MKRKSSWLLSLIMVIAVMCSIAAPAFAAETDGVTTGIEGGMFVTTDVPPEGIPIAPSPTETGTDESPADTAESTDYMPIYAAIYLTETQYQVGTGMTLHMYDKNTGEEYPLVSKSEYAKTPAGFYASSIVFAAPLDFDKSFVKIKAEGDGLTGRFSTVASSWELGSVSDDVQLYMPLEREDADDYSKGLKPETPVIVTFGIDQEPAITVEFFLSGESVNVGNLPVSVSDGVSGNAVKKFTTKAGKLYLDISPTGVWMLNIENTGYTFANGLTIKDVAAAEYNTGAEHVVYVKSIYDGNEQSIGKLTVNTTADTSYPFTSPSWGSYTLNLEKDGVVRQLQCGIGETVMPQIEPGDYNVSVENDEACTVTVPPTLHVGNEGYIEASVSPKYTMEVTKSVNGEQQDYEFKFVGIEDSGTYKGYDATIFAVAPYEVYSLQDLTTERSVQASISPQEPVTKVILGRDIVTGAGASAPHTGDYIMYVVIAFVVLAFVCGIGFFASKNKNAKRMLSLFLALALAGGMLVSFQSASATGGAGTGGQDGESYEGGVKPPKEPYYRTPTGTPPNAGVLRITFMFEATEEEKQNFRTGTNFYDPATLRNMSAIDFKFEDNHIVTGAYVSSGDEFIVKNSAAEKSIGGRTKFFDRTLELYLPLDENTEADWLDSGTGVWRAIGDANRMFGDRLGVNQAANYWEWLELHTENYPDTYAKLPNYAYRAARTLPGLGRTDYKNTDIYKNDIFMQIMEEALGKKTVGKTNLGDDFKQEFETRLCVKDTDTDEHKAAVKADRDAFCESLIAHLAAILWPGKFSATNGKDIHLFVLEQWLANSNDKLSHNSYVANTLPYELQFLKDKIMAGDAAMVLEECIRFEYTGTTSQFNKTSYPKKGTDENPTGFGYEQVMYAPESVLMYMMAQCSQNDTALPYGLNITTSAGTIKSPIQFEARAVDENNKGWGCAGENCTKSACKLYGHVAYTGRAAMEAMYTKTLRPVIAKQYLIDSENAPKVSNKGYADSGNWYGAWGYALISGEIDQRKQQPSVYAEVIYQDENGNEVGRDTKPFLVFDKETNEWAYKEYQFVMDMARVAPKPNLGGQSSKVNVDTPNQIKIETIWEQNGRFAAEQIVSTSVKSMADNICLAHGVVDNCNLFSTSEDEELPAYVGIFRDVLTEDRWKITQPVGGVAQQVVLSYYLGGEDKTGILDKAYSSLLEDATYDKPQNSAEVLQARTLLDVLRQSVGGREVKPSDLRAYGPEIPPYNKVNDIKITVVVKCREVAPVDVKDTVPEWRLTKRWNSLLDFTGGTNDKMYSTFTISPTGPHDGHKHHSVSGGVSIDQVTTPNYAGTVIAKAAARGAVEVFTRVPDVAPANTLWATAVIDKSESVSESKVTATSTLDQRTLAVKEQNSPVGQIHTANWVSDGANRDFLRDVGIDTDIKGVAMTGNTSETYEYLTQYRIANGNNTISHTASKKKDTLFGCECSSIPQTLASPFQFSLSTIAKAKVTLTYERYIPKNTPTATYSSYVTSVNGKTTVSAQATTSLRLWPEVPMLYTTKQSGYVNLPGITGVVYAAGAKERVLTPVSWHTLDYDAYVTPKAVGTAVATDARAVATWHDTKTPVIYKGAGVNMSFDLKLTKGSEKSATLTTKSYILDVGNTAIKNAWGNSAYSPSNINNDFLKTFAEQKDGKWAVKATGIENLKVNGVPDAQQKNTFAQVKNDLTYIENNHSSAEYPIVVRGGLLAYVYIGGTAYSPAEVKSVDLELYDALVGMHLINEDAAKSYETVFSCFEHFGGALVDEPLYVSKVNSVRHGGQPWSVAKDKGWYNEDSTVLTIRVYTTVFDLPASVFADKLPMTIKTSNNSLDTPVDKNQFFSKVEQGFSVLRYTFDANLNPYNQSDVATKTSVYMEHDSKVGGEFGDKAVDYGVPNVSILDTTNLG